MTNKVAELPMLAAAPREGSPSLSEEKHETSRFDPRSELEFQGLSYSVGAKNAEDWRKLLVASVSAKVRAGEVSHNAQQRLTSDARHHGAVVSDLRQRRSGTDPARGAGKSTLLDLMALRNRVADSAKVCSIIAQL